MDDTRSSKFFVVVAVVFFVFVTVFAFEKVLHTPEKNRREAQAKSILNDLSHGIKKNTLFLMKNGSLFFFVEKPSKDNVKVLFGGRSLEYRISDFANLVLRVYPPNVGGIKGKERAEYLRMIQSGKYVVKL